MSLKLIGACMILGGCGSFGFSMAACHRREEKLLQDLLQALEYMRCDLNYRMTPLPVLCSSAAELTDGYVREILSALARELDRQLSPDAGACLGKILEDYPGLPDSMKEILELLAMTLGAFDLPGQLRGLDHAMAQGHKKLEALSLNRDQRLRSYQTLGLCAGAALAILFI